jgi:uncharacterized Zn finger protein
VLLAAQAWEADQLLSERDLPLEASVHGSKNVSGKLTVERHALLRWCDCLPASIDRAVCAVNA